METQCSTSSILTTVPRCPGTPCSIFKRRRKELLSGGNLGIFFRSAHALLPSTALFDRYVRCGRNQASYFQWVTNVWGESRAITTITTINTTRLLICDIPQHIMNVRGLSFINSPNPAMTETASGDKKIALANHREPEKGHNRY